MNDRQKWLLKKFKSALRQFYRNDYALVEYRVAERALTHKLAEHLQRRFKGFSVDCEYNKVGRGDPKRVWAFIASLSCRSQLQCSGDCDECAGNKCVVFPDIIVHTRGEDENLIAIEAKTEWGKGDQTRDLLKLKALAESKNYRYELCIAFRFCKDIASTLDTIQIVGGGASSESIT